LRILKRDESAAFSKLSESDIAQEVLGLFNIKTNHVKSIAAALCGAKVCLGGSRPAGAVFPQAAIWGNCHWRARNFDSEDVTKYAIIYHRYDFPLRVENWAASLAVENRNLIALIKLRSNGIKFTMELLRQAINGKAVEIVSYLVTQVEPNREALELAIRSEDARMVYTIVQLGVIDINGPLTDDGSTALHLAVSVNVLKIVLVILNEPGIDVDAVNDNGETALDIAERNGANEIANLIQHSQKSTMILEN
jgi:hypothetical protein